MPCWFQSDNDLVHSMFFTDVFHPFQKLLKAASIRLEMDDGTVFDTSPVKSAGIMNLLGNIHSNN